MVPWNNLDAYAFPPFALIRRVINTVDIPRGQDDFGHALLAAEGMVPGPSVPPRRLP